MTQKSRHQQTRDDTKLAADNVSREAVRRDSARETSFALLCQRPGGGDRETFSDERALLRDITAKKPGEQVTFRVWRSGQVIGVNATLEPFPKTVWSLMRPRGNRTCI
jgi:hypothetical protein